LQTIVANNARQETVPIQFPFRLTFVTFARWPSSRRLRLPRWFRWRPRLEDHVSVFRVHEKTVQSNCHSFTKEIDAALLVGAIDAAIHSAKDLPSLSPADVTIAAVLPREDARDALISAFADTIEGLPQAATFGAASLRRQAQGLRLRPDLRPALLRGNVETRLCKAEEGPSARPCSRSRA